jgi:tRNA threonylcarbamoyladenosine biosynthesis protein TsaE
MSSAALPDHGAAGAWQPPPGWTLQAERAVASADETDLLAARLADATTRGDTILMSGELGAGKTHFARAFIRHALGPEGSGEEIPSPSFTLVQTYDTPAGEIWHADLYRLGGPDEIVELGLDLAMEEARCLVEWPERMAPDWPERAVLLRLEPDPAGAEEGRLVTLWSPPGSALAARLRPIIRDGLP